MSSCRGLAMPSSVSILHSGSCVEAKGGRWSPAAAPLAGGSWLGVSRYVMMGEKAGCCSSDGGVGNMRCRSATAESRERVRGPVRVEGDEHNYYFLHFFFLDGACFNQDELT